MTEAYSQTISGVRINRSRNILRKNKSSLAVLQFMVDVALVDSLLFLLVSFKGIQDFSLYYYPAGIAPLLMWLIYSNSGIYRRFSGNISSAMNVLWAWSKVVGILIVWAFVTKDSELFSREVILLWIVLAAIVQMGIHVLSNYVVRYYLAKSRQTVPCVVVGNSELAGYLAEHLNKNPWTIHKIIGVLTDSGEDEKWHVKGLPRLGKLSELRWLVEKYHVRRVYFALPMNGSHQIREMQLEILDLNVDIIWAPDIFGLHLVSPSVKELAGVPLYYLSESPMVDGAKFSKMMMDKLLAVIAFLLLLPLLLGAALAVKLSSPGPVFFHQKRHGLDGKTINVLKFRSMKVHDEHDGEITQATQADPRVTKVGNFLRRTSIDELPQLINVLKGDMSLVGPRPHAIKHNEFYADKVAAYMSRHRILPGITGLAQVNGCRGETDTLDKMEKRVEYDLAYINNWSIWMDIQIMIKTVFTLLSKNAY